MPLMDSVHSHGHQSRRARQNPVSCRLCRLKKLKCNRQQPCSNCSNRGLGCEYFAQRSRSSPTRGRDHTETLPTTSENAGFQARLERLEQAVFGNQDGRPSAPAAAMPSTYGALTTTRIPDFASNKELEMTSRWLESIGTLENPTVRCSMLLQR